VKVVPLHLRASGERCYVLDLPAGIVRISLGAATIPRSASGSAWLPESWL
jgi:hypothetical protein